MKSLDVVGIGAAIVDILAKVDDAFLTENDIPKGGMTLVDTARAADIYGNMGPAKEISGGSVANSIAGIAALGGKSAFMGKIKNDQLGEVFAHDIRAAGVNFKTEPMAADSANATARCMVMVTPDAERSMATDLGVSGQFGPNDVNDELIKSADILYLEGYLWDADHNKQAFRRAMKTAKENGTKVALSLSDAFCVERYRDSFAEIVANDIDILFANEYEITALYQEPDFDKAANKAGKDVNIAALTKGAEGSVIVENGIKISVQPVGVSEVVDTTGAGDLFAAGFLYGLSNGHTAAVSAKIGSICAAEIISHIGARPEADLKALIAGI